MSTHMLPGFRRNFAVSWLLLILFSAGAAQAQDTSGSGRRESGNSAASKDDGGTDARANGSATNKGRRTLLNPHRSPYGEGVARNSYMGRVLAPVMSYLGADWLIRPEREIEEDPERMLDALELKPGMTVADVGAGVGYTSVRIAQRVGPTGKVLATDIQPQMIRMLTQNVKAMKLDQTIQALLCTPDDPKLPEGAVDLAIMVDVYHECTHPAETLRGIRKALKPDGRLVLVEFRAEDPDVPIKPEHKMTAAQAKREVESQGFRLRVNHDFLPWQHLLIFEKTPDDPQPGPADTPISRPAALPGQDKDQTKPDAGS